MSDQDGFDKFLRLVISTFLGKFTLCNKSHCETRICSGRPHQDFFQSVPSRVPCASRWFGTLQKVLGTSLKHWFHTIHCFNLVFKLPQNTSRLRVRSVLERLEVSWSLFRAGGVLQSSWSCWASHLEVSGRVHGGLGLDAFGPIGSFLNSTWLPEYQPRRRGVAFGFVLV